ncbi:dTMP kinase [Alkalihalobacillus xiaoxiensis]|uniref:Thymidylate kinase n=1 Tax=Shouchella xiaoxiensis TaxID=766895 RepID=A0ABS2SZZ0_9BACI|nr:dTMP kinase [Shouchella xiaoxiensis]MBM7841098.1 dTMP kinase [Shouchella xiaoxiensis]
MRKGYFITIEGGEGAGKTTVFNELEKRIRQKGHQVVRTREPGGVQLAEQIRDILLHTKDIDMDDRTEALLYAAARREHLVKKVIPALEEGAIVLCDRFIDSSLAYQGYARGIGVEAVRAINEFAVEDYMPDLTLYFSVKPEIGLARVKKDQVRDWNRLDQEKLDFHKRVETGYNLINEEAKDRVQVIDANQSMEKVIEDTLRIVEKHI